MTVEDLKKYFKNKSDYEYDPCTECYWANINRWIDVESYLNKENKRCIISFNDTTAEIVEEWEIKELDHENLFNVKFVTVPKNKIYINLKNTNYNQFKKLMDSSISKLSLSFKKEQVQNKLYKMSQDF